MLELHLVSTLSRRFEATMIETTGKNERNDEDDYMMMVMMRNLEDVAKLETSGKLLI